MVRCLGIHPERVYVKDRSKPVDSYATSSACVSNLAFCIDSTDGAPTYAVCHSVCLSQSRSMPIRFHTEMPSAPYNSHVRCSLSLRIAELPVIIILGQGVIILC